MNIASQADSGQWLVWAPNSAVHRTRVKQRGSCVKPEVATVSLARGVFRGDQRARIGQNKSNQTPGISQDFDAAAYIDITHALRLEHTTLSISRSTVSLQDLSCFKIQTDIARISFFLFLLYNARTFKYFFSFHEFNYLHQNLTDIYIYIYIYILIDLFYTRKFDGAKC